VAVLLGLLSAVSYGTSDFAAGLASRRFAAGPVTGVAQVIGLITALVAVALYPGVGPRSGALAWGAASGIGSALGTLALYHGLSVARMTMVATVSAVLTAVIPVLVGLALGEHVSATAAVGILIAVPAIALVSWHPRAREGASGADRAGLLYGVLAGIGFAVLFIALDRAGTRSGAWPLVPGQIVSLPLVAPFAVRGAKAAGRPAGDAIALVIGAGVLSGVASLLFLAATGHGSLAIVAVLTALYPAVTVLLARAFLAERWTTTQAVGLVTAGAAIVLVSLR
jgi:drug/metabolite transporter (DMT)-like permease